MEPGPRRRRFWVDRKGHHGRQYSTNVLFCQIRGHDVLGMTTRYCDRALRTPMAHCRFDTQYRLDRMLWWANGRLTAGETRSRDRTVGYSLEGSSRSDASRPQAPQMKESHPSEYHELPNPSAILQATKVVSSARGWPPVNSCSM